jgi:hypothetical protein
MKEEKLLGHIISKGVMIDPNRVETIILVGLPINKK